MLGRAASSLLLIAGLLGGVAKAQLVDSLDAYPPRWSLHRSDCDARLSSHQHERDSAAEGGVCEAVTLQSSHGSEAILMYPIEPVRPIDELTATLSIKGVREGLRIGFRVRYPYLLDPTTQRPAEAIVFGATYRRVGEFQRLGIGAITAPLQLKTMALRNQFGADADVSSPYVDAVVVNAYGGPGMTTLRLDELRVDAMVPVAPEESSLPRTTMSAEARRLDPSLDKATLPSEDREPTLARVPFPLGRVTRILQSNGEPLAWVRSLGFDAVWLNQPPTAAILSEAIRSRVTLYAPPPSSPDPRIEPLLEPVAAWIVGDGLPLDTANRDAVQTQVDRLRALPSRWQRPIVGTPVEDFRWYGALLDAAIIDAPPRLRGISAVQCDQIRHDQQQRLGGCPVAVGVIGGPPEVAVLQTDAIAARIGSPPCDHFRWHSLWCQIASTLADSPRAILIRSQTSLASGSELDQNRSLALSFINRQVAALQPWIATSVRDHQPLMVDPQYHARRLASGSTTLLILTSSMTRGEETLAGDGKTLRLKLAPIDEGKLLWRLTHFSAERLTPQTDPSGTAIEIVSPDVVEVIAISDQISEGGRLSQSTATFAKQVALDRWQLAAASLRHVQQQWQQATGSGLIRVSIPNDLLGAAESTLAQTETLVRADDSVAALRLARRADAWVLKTQWMLHDAISAASTSSMAGSSARWFQLNSPPLLAGNLETHLAWWPLFELPFADSGVAVMRSEAPSSQPMRSHWGRNLLAGGDLDRPDSLTREGWTFGRRHPAWATTEAVWTDRGAFAGRGALVTRAIPKGDNALPGGYEGTLMLIRSPATLVPAGSAVRIDLVVRTLGFGDPHQGLLVYDSIGTQELGVLINKQSEWTPITLLRQTVSEAPVHVMFELIGGGEAMIDEVQIRRWENTPNPTTNFYGN